MLEQIESLVERYLPRGNWTDKMRMRYWAARNVDDQMERFILGLLRDPAVRGRMSNDDFNLLMESLAGHSKVSADEVVGRVLNQNLPLSKNTRRRGETLRAFWAQNGKSLAVEELHADAREIQFNLRHPVFQLLVEGLADAFQEIGGKNYVSLEAHHAKLGPLVLTIQRREKKTPHQLRQEAEADRDWYRNACEEIASVLRGMSGGDLKVHEWLQRLEERGDTGVRRTRSQGGGDVDSDPNS